MGQSSKTPGHARGTFWSCYQPFYFILFLLLIKHLTWVFPPFHCLLSSLDQASYIWCNGTLVPHYQSLWYTLFYACWASPSGAYCSKVSFFSTFYRKGVRRSGILYRGTSSPSRDWKRITATVLFESRTS